MRLSTLLVFTILLAMPLTSGAAYGATQHPDPVVPVDGLQTGTVAAGRLVITLRTPLGAMSRSDLAALTALGQPFGISSLTPLFHPAPRDSDSLRRFQALGMDRMFLALAAKDADMVAASLALSSHPAVERVEDDPIGSGGGLPNDPAYSLQWHLPQISATSAWDISTGSSHVTVAILDTGIAGWHPDLRSRIWYNPGEIDGNGVDDDGNGYVDDNWGWDFVNNDRRPEGDHWHGTHIAGIVGAEANNGIGIAGLNHNARLMAVKVLDANNEGYYSVWAQGIYYAVQNGARVLNLSLGGSVTGHTALRAAIDYAYGSNALIVVAMMNTNSSTPFYPAAYPNTVAVGATDRYDQRANPFSWGGGSNYGSYIDVVAPGNLVYSTGLNDSYISASGTSMATPLVAALGALIWSVAPSLTNDEVRRVIRDTADDRVGRSSEDTPGWDAYHGYGRINARRALERARVLAGNPPPPTSTPVPSPSSTPTPAVSPTPRPTLAAGCGSLVVNGSFDGSTGWTFSGRRAVITGSGHAGSAAFIGLLSGDAVENPLGDWASVRQDVTLPSGAAHVRLSFWALTAHTGSSDPNDRFIARLLTPTGTLRDIPLVVDSGTWVEYAADVTSDVAAASDGRFTLYFGVKNMPGTGGNAFMRVDDVALEACTTAPPATPTPNPATPVPPGAAGPPTPYPRGSYTLVLPRLTR